MKRRHNRILGLSFIAWRNILAVLVGLGFLFSGIVLIWLAQLDIPSVDGFTNRKVEQSTKIYDRTGKVLLFDVHGNVRRTIIPLDQMSRHVKNATIAIEDAEFYQHRGVKPDAILRAALVNIREGRFSQGGSTITQQVIKNTVLTNEKTITRKIKEWVLALKLERQLTKDQILEIYFNETPYGGTIYGIEEASIHFFNKKAVDLTLAESAYLAALPQAPTYYSPFGNHREDLENRKNLVLVKMLENNFINQKEFEEARSEEVTFLAQSDNSIKAPHFVFFVREYLEEEYGVNAVLEQGLKVVTTLDYELQAHGEEIVNRYALENAEKFNAENASLVAIDPKTGQILTMVGSRGYFDEEIDGQFNISRAKRQPGSAFKPLVYAAGFEKGYTPDTVLFDLQTQFSTNCEVDFLESSDECYAPVNYDNVFRGPMSLRDALAQSVNIPAVKILYLVGIDAALDIAERLGITTIDNSTASKNRLGLTLVLGGGEVSLLDMTSAYSVFANEGERHPYVSILRIEDAEGNILEEFEEKKGEQVIDTEVTRMVSDVLTDNQARTPAFGSRSFLYFPGADVAAKTGTTNDYRDAWIVGYNPNVAVGSWAGNNDNSPMDKKVAGFIVAPMWNEFMQRAIEKFPSDGFTPPQQPENYEELPPIVRGVWNDLEQVTTDGVHSILYWVDKESPLAGKPQNPIRDPQFIYWESAVARWLDNEYQIPLIAPGSNNPTPITQTPTAPQFVITYPQNGATVQKGVPINFLVAHTAPDEVKKVSYYLNGSHIGTVGGAPFSLTFVFPEPGRYTLRATSEDSSWSAQSAETTFTVR